MRWQCTATILDKAKDAIEEACELAHSKPKLFVPALRLIRRGLRDEESMVKLVEVLVSMNKMSPEADSPGMTTFDALDGDFNTLERKTSA